MDPYKASIHLQTMTVFIHLLTIMTWCIESSSVHCGLLHLFVEAQGVSSSGLRGLGGGGRFTARGSDCLIAIMS